MRKYPVTEVAGYFVARVLRRGEAVREQPGEQDCVRGGEADFGTTSRGHTPRVAHLLDYRGTV